MIETFTSEDIVQLQEVQPEEWSDIRPYFQYYVSSEFCDPVKLVRGKQILGVGAAIRHQDSVWLAHIIIHKAHRKQGLGGVLTKALTDRNRQLGFKTQLLIATDLGYPVYLKCSFEVVTEYVHFAKGKEFVQPDISGKILKYDAKFYEAILALDYLVSGEKREKVLQEYLSDAVLLVVENQLEGFYLPALGDGPVIVKNSHAGLELTKYRLLEKDNAMLPIENQAGIRFLRDTGLIETKKVKRMGLGEMLNWKPELLFNRIGGHLG